MPATPDKYQTGTITWRKDHAPDLWSIKVRLDERLAFKPGQYATLAVESGGRTIERAYSIVSAPHEDELELFFELIPHGELTPLLHPLQPGDTLRVRRRAKGAFLLDEASGRDLHAFFCTVTGIAPVVSIVRSLARRSEEGEAMRARLLVLQAASRSWELSYQGELEAAAHAHDWLRYVPLVSRPWEDDAWRGEVGRVEDVARKHADLVGFEPGRTTAYVCGHPGMSENVKAILLRRGFPRETIRVEAYWQPPSRAPASSDAERDAPL